MPYILKALDIIICFHPGYIYKTDSSTKNKGFTTPGVIAGVAAALVLLLALILVAFYIQCHPTVGSPLLLIQVSSKCCLHLFLQTGWRSDTTCPHHIICFTCRDARATGPPWSFKSSSLVTRKWREKAMKDTASLKLGLAEIRILVDNICKKWHYKH